MRMGATVLLAAACGSSPVGGDGAETGSEVPGVEGTDGDGDGDGGVGEGDGEAEGSAGTTDAPATSEGDADSGDEESGPAEGSGGGGKTLSLWTFNLLNPANPLSMGADVELRTAMVVDLVEQEQPDLIALQEVVSSAEVPNRAQHIADATGYDWVWQVEYALGYEEGIAVLSKTPIDDSEAVELPHKDLVVVSRYALGVTTTTDAGEVDFYASHMTVGGNETQSADQAVAVWQFVTSRSAGRTAFFGGDLNAEPNTPAMQFFRGEAGHAGALGDFTDLWIATQGEADGFTIESDDPHDRIDYLYAAATGDTPVTPQDCKLIFADPVEGIYASDHIGVACTVTIGAP